jgi:diguanylate cyclase (GGDEF)-like protein/PAS domain S-box-containing protein
MKINSSNSSPYLDVNDKELLFKMVFNQHFQFMAILSPEGRVLEVNDLALSSQGVTQEDYVGKLFWKSPAWCNFPEWESIWKRRLVEASNQHSPVITEDVFQIEDGSLHYADASTTAVYDLDNGKLTGFIVQAIDTTKRRKIEQQIKENEARLKFVLEHSHIGTWELNLNDHTSHRSLKHDQIFGYESLLPQFTYEMFLEHVLPEDRVDVENKFQLAIDNQTDWDFECQIVRKGGEIRWISATGGHVFNSTGQAKVMAGIVQDVTNVKQAENERLRHSAELKSLFKALPDIYFRMMNDGTIIDYQTQNINELYINPDNFIGKRMQDILPESLGILFKSKIDEIKQNNKIVAFNYELTINDKESHFDARLNRIAINDQLICVIRDVTEEVRSKKALAISEQRFRTIFEQAAIGVALVNPNTREFIRINQRFCDMLGYSVKEMLNGKTFEDITHPDDLKMSIDHHNHVVAGQQHEITLEKRYCHKDGHIVWAELTASTTSEIGDQAQSIIVVVQDISERKKADKIITNTECKLRKSIAEERKANLSLTDSRKQYHDLIEEMSDIVTRVNVAGNLVFVNSAATNMFGLAAEECIGKSAFDFIHPDDIIKTKESFSFWLGHNKGTFLFENRQVSDDGRIFNVAWSIHSEYDEFDNLIGFASTGRDITDQKLAEEKLKLAANVFTHAGEGIIITDASGAIIDVNNTFTTITGYSRIDVIGKNPRFLQSGRQSHDFYTNMWLYLKKEGYWSGEVWNRRKNGEVYAEMLTISSVKDAHGKVSNYVGLFTDITLMKEHQDQLERIAHYDLLTNLPNRVLLADRLSQVMLQCTRHKQSVAVVFLDLDGFKAINDEYGHDVGDELLIAISVRMKEGLRECDSLARIGGDEFVAVLADLITVEDCEPILERLLLAASEPITINDMVLNISVSIGVTLYPEDNVDGDLLMRHADQAMYAAKESGKNRYQFFDMVQDDAIKEQRESLEAIRNALDNNQFVLYYQPKVNMRTGTVTGVEALIRWQHPNKGLLNPIDFLPIIENHTMMIELGEWVIDSALSQISQWQAMGLNLPLNTSVNIAVVQLQQPDFIKKLTSSLKDHPDVKPHHLELEVLETSALEDVQLASTIMNDCIGMGVSFALDDFGTGYSSLTYLRRLPASLIKIDQTFVRDMLIDSDDLAIVEGVIALAKSFKRDVIAEGVETVEHGTALMHLGCELAQGYGIAKPMPAIDIPTWINDWKPDVSWKV